MASTMEQYLQAMKFERVTAFLCHGRQEMVFLGMAIAACLWRRSFARTGSGKGLSLKLGGPLVLAVLDGFLGNPKGNQAPGLESRRL